MTTVTTQRAIRLIIDGTPYDQWLTAEVSRDLKDFSGSFSFRFRDATRALAALPYASATATPVLMLRPGPAVDIMIGERLVLRGWIDRVSADIDDGQSDVTISGRDRAGDLIDCAAVTDGPAELRGVTLEDAVRRIAAPYGLSVRSEIEPGEPIDRYAIDIGETAWSAIEKGTRSRHALIVSDGVGGLVITQTGKDRAPDALTMPGNARRASAEFSIEGRHSETIVRGQGERAGKRRGKVKLDGTAEPLAPAAREGGDGSATTRERHGTAATGRVTDAEVTRHRPAVHLARSKADTKEAQSEADWRSRTARAESEEITYVVHGHDVNGRPWLPNQIVPVSDAWLDVERDMLISKVTYREDDDGRTTDIGVVSPEAFDARPVGDRRSNKPGKKAKKAKKKTGPLDGTAHAL